MIINCPVCAEELEIPNDVKIGDRVLCESCNQYFALTEAQVAEVPKRNGWLGKLKLTCARFVKDTNKVAIMMSLIMCVIQCIFIIMIWKNVSSMETYMRLICRSTLMIKNDVSDIESDVSRIESDVSTIESDVSSIESDISYLRIK